MRENNYYDDIDEMPLYNWRKCQRGEIEYTRTDKKNGTKKEDTQQWEMIYDSYLKEFGLGKEYERYFELKIELAEAQCDYVIDDDRFILNRINHLEEQIQDILTKDTGGDPDRAVVQLSKWIGGLIDERTIKVKLFYKMLDEYKRESDLLKKQQNKNK